MSFSVSANMYLRNCYATTDRSLCVKTNRANKTTGTLSFADSSALKKAIRNLGDFDYDADDKETEFTYKIKSFIDSYNYTLDSSSSSSQDDIAKAAKRLKSVSNKYSGELKKLGITTDKNGYMSISSSATTNISTSKYKEMFGVTSEYMSELKRYSSRITSHVDVLL